MGTMMKPNLKITKENIEKLKEVYKYVYKCDKCSTNYGSDKKEKDQHLCPMCEEK